MRIQFFKVLNRWVDLDHILSISAPEVNDGGSGPPCVMFEIQFMFLNSPTRFARNIPIREYRYSRDQPVPQYLYLCAGDIWVKQDQIGPDQPLPLELVRYGYEIEKLVRAWTDKEEPEWPGARV